MADKVLAALRLALEIDGWEVKEVITCQAPAKSVRIGNSAVTIDATNTLNGTTL